jgi:hypothetical protein
MDILDTMAELDQVYLNDVFATSVYLAVRRKSTVIDG